MVYCSLKNIPLKNSVLMAINSEGIMKYTSQNKNFNGDTFTQFVNELIVENKIEDTYFLMDNIPFHKRALQTIKDSKNHVLFIPPYSPEFNPIEEVFSSLKSYIKKYMTPLHTKFDINQLIDDYIKEHPKTIKYYNHAFGIQEDEYG